MDLDYAISPLTNCENVNLKDMFANGTMIGNVMVETPKSLRTATTVATQISASVASSTFGGQTMSLAHLAPFVDVSRQKLKKELANEILSMGVTISDNQIEELAEKRLMKEIKDSIQTLNYQLNSFTTTNGQTPFITIFIALSECENDQEKKDLSLLASELFKQRIKGMKNKDGVYVTQTFPKLIYVLDEENIHDDSEYFELTKLAAKCTAKRMVPDYMSAKKLMEIKKAIMPVMGCVDKKETVTIRIDNKIQNISIGELYQLAEKMKKEKI